MQYLSRIVDKEIDELMQIMGAVLIEGCKGCGKLRQVLSMLKV